VKPFLALLTMELLQKRNSIKRKDNLRSQPIDQPERFVVIRDVVTGHEQGEIDCQKHPWCFPCGLVDKHPGKDARNGDDAENFIDIRLS